MSGRGRRGGNGCDEEGGKEERGRGKKIGKSGEVAGRGKRGRGRIFAEGRRLSRRLRGGRGKGWGRREGGRSDED